jgi:perosamine synthetase
LLREIPGIRPQGGLPRSARRSWFAYVVRLAPEIDRDLVIAELERRGVPSRAYFPAIHLQPVYRERFGFREGEFPIAERVAASTLALPFHTNLSSGDSQYVVEALAAAIARAGG